MDNIMLLVSFLLLQLIITSVMADPQQLQFAMKYMPDIERMRRNCSLDQYLDYHTRTCKDCDRHCPGEQYDASRCGHECQAYFNSKKLNRQMMQQNITLKMCSNDKDDLKALTVQNQRLTITLIIAIIVWVVTIIIAVIIYKGCKSSPHTKTHNPVGDIA